MWIIPTISVMHNKEVAIENTKNLIPYLVSGRKYELKFGRGKKFLVGEKLLNTKNKKVGHFSYIKFCTSLENENK